MKKTARLSLRVTLQIRQQVEALAKSQSLPKSELLRRAIEAYLKNHPRDGGGFDWIIPEK